MGAAYTGADLFVDSLERYGVSRVFGNPGTTELPVVMAVGASEDVEYTFALHEDIAVGMASGYARNRRYRYHHDDRVNPVGVVNLHITPGVAHGLGNLYAADIAGAPLVVTAGNNSLDHRHREPALSGDLLEMTEQFTKWSTEVLDVDTLPDVLRRAFRVALTPPTGPVFLSLPLDVMNEETDRHPERLGPIPTAGRGDPAQIAHAADLLVDADEPVFVVGDAIARAGVDAIESVVELAEATGATVYAEMLASEVNFPSAHEQFASFLPLSADVARSALDTDLVAFVGCSTNTPLTSFEGRLVDLDTTCIHVSDDPAELGKNEPADAAIVGDPGSVTGEITADLDGRIGDDELRRRRSRIGGDGEGDGGSSDDARGDGRITKQELADKLHAVASDAYLVDEAITASWTLKLYSEWEFEPEHYQLNKGAGLGYGLPAAVGAALAESESEEPRPVVGYVGDGSFLYYPHSLYSAFRHEVDLTIVVPDNRSYEVLKSNVVGMYGGSVLEYDLDMMDISPPVDIPAIAESQGIPGVLIEERDEVESALEHAIASDGPAVLDVLVRETVD